MSASYGRCMFNAIKKTAKLFSGVSVSFCISTSNVCNFLYPRCSSELSIVKLSKINHSSTRAAELTKVLICIS